MIARSTYLKLTFFSDVLCVVFQVVWYICDGFREWYICSATPPTEYIARSHTKEHIKHCVQSIKGHINDYIFFTGIKV